MTKPATKTDVMDDEQGAPMGLLATVEAARVRATSALDPGARAELGQFLTPAAVASFMASMSDRPKGSTVRVLDAGAGVGSLSAALVDVLLGSRRVPSGIEVTAYEVDPPLLRRLRHTMALCEGEATRSGVRFKASVLGEDFILSASEMVEGGLLAPPKRFFDVAILNPPYKKIRTDSPERRRLQAAGLETTNLYTAFLYLAAHLLVPGGELIAITPRSFCNGPYFRNFRRAFLSMMAVERIHVFDRRDKAFGDDGVLQENVIFRARRVAPDAHRASVHITTSHAPGATDIRERVVPYSEVVHPEDADSFIHIVADEANAAVAERMRGFNATLSSLGVSVSTGPVVDFRAREHLRKEAGAADVPLLYQSHMVAGRVAWPKPDFKKFNAIVRSGDTERSLVPNGNYVLVRRFSAKEERRRVVAAILLSSDLPYEKIGLENHVNYFHAAGQGLPLDLARGLVTYLNSTLVDAFFRQFNGHTQVNATDLRVLPYPSRERLVRLGTQATERVLDQDEIDALVETVLAAAPAKVAPKARKARKRAS